MPWLQIVRWCSRMANGTPSVSMRVRIRLVLEKGGFVTIHAFGGGSTAKKSSCRCTTSCLGKTVRRRPSARPVEKNGSHTVTFGGNTTWSAISCHVSNGVSQSSPRPTIYYVPILYVDFCGRSKNHAINPRPPTPTRVATNTTSQLIQSDVNNEDGGRRSRYISATASGTDSPEASTQAPFTRVIGNRYP